MRLLLAFGFICFQYLSAFAQLIPISSVWHNYDLAQAPPNQSGITWKQIAYDHSSWNSGPAQLGYGDGDEATDISSSTLTGLIFN